MHSWVCSSSHHHAGLPLCTHACVRWRKHVGALPPRHATPCAVRARLPRTRGRPRTCGVSRGYPEIPHGILSRNPVPPQVRARHDGPHPGRLCAQQPRRAVSRVGPRSSAPPACLPAAGCLPRVPPSCLPTIPQLPPWRRRQLFLRKDRGEGQTVAAPPCTLMHPQLRPARQLFGARLRETTLSPAGCPPSLSLPDPLLCTQRRGGAVPVCHHHRAAGREGRGGWGQHPSIACTGHSTACAAQHNMHLCCMPLFLSCGSREGRAGRSGAEGRNSLLQLWNYKPGPHTVCAPATPTPAAPPTPPTAAAAGGGAARV